MIEKIFFELLQVAVGTRDELSRMLSAKDWDELYEIAKKQSLVGFPNFSTELGWVWRQGFSSGTKS